MILVEKAAHEEAALSLVSKSEFLVARVSSLTRHLEQKRLKVFSIRTDDAFIFFALCDFVGERRSVIIRRLREAAAGRRILVKDPLNFHEFTTPHGTPLMWIR